MKTTQDKKRYIELDPVRPPVAIGLEYQRKLSKLTRALKKDVDAIITDKSLDAENNFENKPLIRLIAMDESPFFMMQNKLKLVFEKYKKIFNGVSLKWASKFIDDVDAFDDRHVKKMIASKALNIQPDEGYIGIVNTKKDLIADNVALISSLPDEYYSKITEDMTKTIAKGGNLKTMKDKLLERGIQTEERAKRIARDQLFKATGIIDNERMIKNGIYKARWKHSHGDKIPRKSHLEADGQIFDTSTGCLIDGEFILPKEKIGCTCFSIPVIEY